jgi:hypothetical protein
MCTEDRPAVHPVAAERLVEDAEVVALRQAGHEVEVLHHRGDVLHEGFVEAAQLVEDRADDSTDDSGHGMSSAAATFARPVVPSASPDSPRRRP